MPNYLIFILLAIVPFVISKEYEFSSILYDFNGTCNDTYLCLPFSNISFSYIWENITQEEIIQELNKEVKKCPAIKRKVFFKESRVKSNDIGLFAEEEIDFNTTIGSFTPKTSITSDMDFSMFEGKDYYEQFLTFPQLNLSSDNTNNTYKMIFSLLYHAYHFEDSPFQLMFKAFPSKPNVPMFTLSIYEWKLLKPDMAFREISLSRQNIIRRYFIFNYLLNETWTPEQRRIIFNGRDEIPIDDFVYCYFIYLTRAVTISVSKDELFSSIAPFTNHIKRYKEDFNADRKQSIYLKTDDTRVRYNAHDYYEVDDEIYIDVRPIDNYYYFIVHGYFYNHNPYDCFNIQFLSEEDSKSIGLKQAECVNAKHISLERYYLICNLYNMEEKDRLACQRKIKKFEKDEGQRIRTMFEKCKHPKWKKWNIFELPKKQLEEYTIAYQKMLQKTKEYLYFRLKDQKSTETARQIYEYLSTKLVVAGDLLIRMESLEEIQVKLPKLNKKAKKEYQKKQAIQRKQEKKLEKKELEEQIIKEIQEKGEPNYEEEIDEYEEQQQQEQQQNKFQQIQDEFKEQVHVDL